jgi:putative membrane protein
MTRLAVALAIALGAPSGTALAADPPPRSATRPAVAMPTTKEFLSKTAVGNLFEIESSKLALSRAKTKQVRTFADEMVRDHTEAGMKFKQAVSDGKLTMPPVKLDSQHQAALNELKSKDRASFDKAYVDEQYKAHVETVDMFQAYADGGDDARMKLFAEQMLPILKTHLDHAIKLREGR